MDHPLAQPYIPSWMKQDFGAMSIEELRDLHKWEGLPQDIFATCRTKQDHVEALKAYVNRTLLEQQQRKQQIIDQETEWRVQMAARNAEVAEERTR